MNNRTISLLIITILAIFGFKLYAQGDVTSPYSFIGLGDNYKKGNIRALSMGGIDIALRNNMYINMVNPAGLSGIDSLSFVGNLGVGLTNSSYRTSDLTSKFSSANINHLGIAFPLARWWKTSLVILPYSSVGYEVYDYSQVENGGTTKFIYKGDGGLDAITWGNAFSINKRLAIGINSTYYFGKLDHSKGVTFPDSAFIFNTLVKEKVVLKGYFFEAGIQYHQPLNATNTLSFGLTYGNNSKLNTTFDYVSMTYFGDDVYNNSSIDTIRIWSAQKATLTLPYTFGAGIAWVKENKLTVGFDFHFENWEKFKYKDQNIGYSNKLSASIGAEFIPESNTLSAYWKMVHYRMGFRYEHLGMKFEDTELKEYALSVGFGLPLRKSKTFVDLGFELGQNGTIDKSLIQERYFRVLLGIAIKETWFRKSKYL